MDNLSALKFRCKSAHAKNAMIKFPAVLFICFLFVAAEIGIGFAQQPVDGREHIFHDQLLDNLVGDWKITRKFKTRTVESSASAEWVLNHQFLLIRIRDVSSPPQYEANVYIGYDNTSERYVAHWIDLFGGRFSETLGYGTRSGNIVKFVFEYPDGPFLNTFTWNPDKKSWSFLMQQKDQSGKWTLFAEDTLLRK